MAAVGAIVVPTLTATSASAATGTFEDELGDAYSYSFPSSVNPEADIDRAELRLDGEVVQVRVYLDAVSPAYDDQTTISAYLETDDATYDMNRVPPGADPSTSGFQDGLQVLSTQPGGGMLWQPVPDCPVRSVLSSAARSVTLSVDARCVGDPARARTIVTVVNDYGGNRVAQDWAPVDNAQLSSWVDAGPSGANLPIAPVYRFWSPGFQNAHFFTTNVDEASRRHRRRPELGVRGCGVRGVRRRRAHVHGGDRRGVPVLLRTVPVALLHHRRGREDPHRHVRPQLDVRGDRVLRAADRGARGRSPSTGSGARGTASTTSRSTPPRRTSSTSATPRGTPRGSRTTSRRTERRRTTTPRLGSGQLSGST